MSKFKLSRRAALRGAGGIAVGLPLLDLMVDSKPSLADTPAKRFVMCFAGTSTSGNLYVDGDDPLHNEIAPPETGPYTTIGCAIDPFGPASHAGEFFPGARYDVASEVAIVSGLEIPTAPGGMEPPGGKPHNFHWYMFSPLLTGVRSRYGDFSMTSPTVDQVVAEAFAARENPADSPTFPSLQFRIQADGYLSGPYAGEPDRMSYKSDGAGGVIPLAPDWQPSLAFEKLFGPDFQHPSELTPEELAERDYRFRARNSVVDLVRADAERLVKRLGGRDKQRLERHLEEIFELERILEKLPPLPGAACQPVHPGEDPPVGSLFTVGPGCTLDYEVNMGYSGEEERARAFMDLVHFAFACDLTRVVSVLFTGPQCFMNMYPLTGQADVMHGMTHNGGGTHGVSHVIAWHMKHFAYLMDKLRTDALIEDTAAVFTFEGGHGMDHESGYGNSPHSTENMVMLVGGRAGGLQAGHHIKTDRAHPAQVLVSAMQAVGVETDQLGEVQGGIPGLLV
jgi:hypothetical protein